jgi:Domain of unknown function (DU1801)
MAQLPTKELIGFLESYDQSVRELALALREFVLEEVSPCHEYIYDAYNAVAMGFGPTERLKDGICHIAVYAKHVNLGFNRGATLDDPEGLLVGSGKWTRHITISGIADLARPEIRVYLRRARAQVMTASAAGRDRADKVISVVKVRSPRKRRPEPGKVRRSAA